MEQYNDHIDDLIGKNLSGEASEQDRRALEEWISISDDNRKYFDHLKLIFEKAATTRDLRTFDTDAAWHKVRQRMLDLDPKTRKLSTRFDGRFFFRVAATLLLLAVVGYWLKGPGSEENSKKVMAIASGTNTVNDTLPDGTNVFLNKKSNVRYAFNEKKKQHIVKLSGEAYFKIQHEDKKEFVVKTDELYIKDIGTAFNVKAYPGSNTVEVTVQEGVVIFYTDDNPGVQLHAGGKGVYDKRKKEFTVEQPEENVLSYKTRSFTFVDAKLTDVASALNAVYDRKIIVGENLSNCRLTVSFNHEEIDVIATVITETLGLTVRQEGNDLVLEGKGCVN